MTKLIFMFWIFVSDDEEDDEEDDEDEEEGSHFKILHLNWVL